MLAHGTIDAGTSRLELHAVDKAIRGRGIVNVSGYASFGIARKEEFRVMRRALRRSPDVDAWFSQTLHGLKADHQTGPFSSGCSPAGTAPAAQTTRSQHGLLGAPFSGQGSDLSRWNGAFLFRPLRRLWNAVFFAQDVVFPLVKTNCPRLDVLLVVEIFGGTAIGYGTGQSVIRSQPRRKPLVRQTARRVIEIWVNENHLDPQILKPLTTTSAFKCRVDSAGGLGVTRPKHNHFRVL